MNAPEIRWIQRLANYRRGLARLADAVELSRQRPLSLLEQQGLVQAFEFTHELAWNTLKDFLQERGATGLYGSKDTTREAFRLGLIDNGELWMGMIRSRNLSTHTYNEATAQELAREIADTYFAAFQALLTQLSALANTDTAE
jgi:nucleotidyltransferase substrate binding protein (TIGR01987 family)